MGKKRTIKITSKQLAEIADIGADFLGNGDYEAYNGNKETSTTEKITSREKDGNPVTTDKIAQSIYPRNYFGTSFASNSGVRSESRKNVAVGLDEESCQFIADIIAEAIKEEYLNKK